MKINYNLINEAQKLESRIDILTESSPISDYENYMFMQQRIQHKENLTFQNLEQRLKNIFKTIDAELFVDRRPDFERIKKKLLKKYPKTESKLKSHLTGETLIRENAEFIKNCLCE